MKSATPNRLHNTIGSRRIKLLISSLLIGSLSLLMAASTTETRIIYVEEELPTSMNPLFPKNDADRRVHQLVFDYVYERSVVSEGFRSRIIDTVSSDPEGQSFQLTLKKGLRWHDKEPITALDLCFSIRALQHQDTPTTWPVPSTIRSCEATDLLTSQITFEQPIADLPAHLNFPLIPAHQFESPAIGNDHGFGLNPVGSGPMRAQLDDRNNWQLEAHKSPHVASKIDQITLESGGDLFAQTQLMLAGAVDGMIRVPPSYMDEIAESPILSLKPNPSSEWWFVALNTSKQPLVNTSIRAALDALLNRSELRLTGLGESDHGPGSSVHWMTGPFLPNSGYENKSLYPTLRADPDKAASLFTKAGYKRLPNQGSWVKGQAPIRLTIGILESIERLAPEFSSVIGAQLRSGGIEVIFKQISNEQWQQSVRPGFISSLDMLIGKSEESSIYGINALFHSTGEQNFFRYANPTADRLLDGLKLDPASMEAHFAAWELHTLITQDRPYLFLWHLESWSAWATRVQPVVITPHTYFADFESWNIKP
jgi:peptide/nickel transport system substrate-binding protein